MVMKVMTILLVILMSLSLILILTHVSEGKVITVDDDGTGDYQTLQDAIDNADEAVSPNEWLS